MQERPELWLLIRTDNSRHVERLLHLALSSAKLPTFGREWYLTSPDAVERIIQRPEASGTIGDQLRLERLSQGLSQAELAVKAKVRQATVSAVESDKGMVSTVQTICEALGKRLTIADA